MLYPNKNTIVAGAPVKTAAIPTPPSTIARPSKTAAPKAPAGTALVVEDDLKSAQLIRILLETHGFKVLHAPSAEAAMVLASEHELSLITLDIMLPHMDGLEFLVRLKRVPELALVPLVVISSVADRAQVMELGASAVLLKPMRRQEFQDTFIALGIFPPTELEEVTELA